MLNWQYRTPFISCIHSFFTLSIVQIVKNIACGSSDTKSSSEDENTLFISWERQVFKIS